MKKSELYELYAVIFLAVKTLIIAYSYWVWGLGLSILYLLVYSHKAGEAKKTEL